MTGIDSDKRIRVAYVFQNIGINFSAPYAAQLHILNTLRGLQERGHDAYLLALQPQRRVLFTNDLDAIVENRITGKHYGRAGMSDNKFFRFFESGIRKIQEKLHIPYLAFFDNYRMMSAITSNLRGYELIHERYNKHTIGGMLASRKLNIPYVLEVNSDPIAESKFRGISLPKIYQLLFAWEIRMLAKNASKIISVSSQLKTFLSTNWNVDPKKIAILANAADIKIFGKKYDRDEIRRRLGLRDDPVILFVGGFYAWHDLNLLLDSFTRILDKFPSAKLVLVGQGDTKSLIEKKIIAQHLERAVIMTGNIDHDRVPEMLSIADITVAPFTEFFPGQGGSPLKLFEYMAAGKAIVCTRTGQVAEIIDNGNDGLLVEPGDVIGFAQALDLLLSDPNLRAQLGQNAAHKAGEEYTQGHYAKRLEEIYLEVLDRNA